MLAFRGTCAALGRSCDRLKQCYRPTAPTCNLLCGVWCSFGSSLHLLPRATSRVFQGYPGTLRSNGTAPKQRAAAPEPVISLPPTYELLPDDVHCLVGLNGSGKTQFLARLQDHVKAQQARGELPVSCRLASLSLDAHRTFGAKNGERVVAQVLGGIGSPLARDLIVRLGLFPVWEQQVRYLSTGEMRKLLLAVALLETPKASVLILDQPFDGLDVKARTQLQWMLGQLTKGFTRLLVETIGAKHKAFAYKTQLLLVANRLEPEFCKLFSHTVLFRHGQGNEEFEMVAWSKDRESNARNHAMKQRLEAFFMKEHEKQIQLTDPELVSLVEQLFKCQDQTYRIHGNSRAVELNGVSISYGRQSMLLEDVNFVRSMHEHWVLLGPNGSGKSSLMRVLMEASGHGLTKGEVIVVGEHVRPVGSSSCRDGPTNGSKPRRQAISTDQHIQILHNSMQSDTADHYQSAFSLIEHNAASPEAAKLAMHLLLLPQAVHTRALSQLSQGEQKLVLIARALAACPRLLILDEIYHGLDPFNRAHVLRVIDTIGHRAAQLMHMVLITHHEEEITSCFSNIFEIENRQIIERPR